MTSYPPTEVIRGLVWLGSMVDANDLDFLQRNNIKVVINAATDREKTMHPVHVYRQLDAQDALGYPLLERHADDATKLLSVAVARGDPVLIHCAAGINRSAALLVDFLVKLTGIQVQKVIMWLRSLRPIVLSNESFVHQLIQAHSSSQ